VQRYAAALVSLAALGADDARLVVQVPEEGIGAAGSHQRDLLDSASRLHVDRRGVRRVVTVDALQALRDAKVQCAVSPGAPASPARCRSYLSTPVMTLSTT
jgi:hypothetical protein